MLAARSCICALALLTACLACSDDGSTATDTSDETGDAAVPACIEYELEGCSLLYPASYDQVWNQTLGNGCAQFGTACHAQEDAAGALDGLTFVDPLLSWEHMLMSDSPLVVAGDPNCSELFVRLATDDPSISMPPGSTGLDDPTLCSIGTWIAEGATYTAP